MTPEQIKTVFDAVGHEAPDERSLRTMSRWIGTFRNLDYALGYEPVKGDTLIPRFKAAYTAVRLGRTNIAL